MAEVTPVMHTDAEGLRLVNLHATFGHRYRTGWEADGATKSQWPREDWPWLMEIRCRYGMVYPQGGAVLQAFSDHPAIGTKLRRLPGVLKSRGDAETVICFHVDHIADVLAILKPYRRRQVSDAERERLRALSTTHGFKKGRPRITESAETTLRSDEREPERTQASTAVADSLRAARERI